MHESGKAACSVIRLGEPTLRPSAPTFRVHHFPIEQRRTVPPARGDQNRDPVVAEIGSPPCCQILLEACRAVGAPLALGERPCHEASMLLRGRPPVGNHFRRSEEHTSELQTLMRIPY